MQELFYTSQSGQLILQKESTQTVQWNGIDNLIVCGSLQEYIAFSSSVVVARFPIDGTNVYYTTSFFNPADIYEPFNSPDSNLALVFTLSDIDPLVLGDTKYFITSSATSVSGSGSAEEFSISTTSDTICNIIATGSGTYNAYISIYDTTAASIIPGVPGTLITSLSGSDVGISASVYLSSSTFYKAYIDIIGSYLP